MMDAGRVARDVSGAERERFDVPDLLELFRKTTGNVVEDDQLVLS